MTKIIDMNTMPPTPKETVLDMTTVFGITALALEDLEPFQSDVGSIVLESAIVQYMITLPPDDQTAVAEWIETHAMDIDFLEQFSAVHPQFEIIFLNEIQNFTTEAGVLLK